MHEMDLPPPFDTKSFALGHGRFVVSAEPRMAWSGDRGVSRLCFSAPFWGSISHPLQPTHSSSLHHTLRFASPPFSLAVRLAAPARRYRCSALRRRALPRVHAFLDYSLARSPSPRANDADDDDGRLLRLRAPSSAARLAFADPPASACLRGDELLRVRAPKA